MDNVSYSLSQYRYETNGFRQNDDQEHDIYDAFAQVSVTPKLSLQAEYRYNDLSMGDLSRIFYNMYDPDYREKDFNEFVRGGLHYALTPHSDIIASSIYATLTGDEQLFPGYGINDNEYAYTVEGQYLFHGEQFNLTTGAGHFKAYDNTVYSFFPYPPTVDKTDTKHTNAYSYLQLKLIKAAVLTLGVSTDFYDGVEGKHDQMNPKAGLIWNPFPDTTIRAAYFKVLKRMLLGDQTIEPTQVAGFNQFFDDVNATKSTRYGVGIDQKLSASFFAGAEFSRRNVESPLLSYTVEYIPSVEKLARYYLYWTPTPRLALKAEYQYEEFDLDSAGSNAYAANKIQTHRVPLEIAFFDPSGFIFKWKPTYINQHGRFINSMYEFGRDKLILGDGRLCRVSPPQPDGIDIG